MDIMFFNSGSFTKYFKHSTVYTEIKIIVLNIIFNITESKLKYLLNITDTVADIPPHKTGNRKL